MKYSVIITAWKEPVTTAETIKMLLHPDADNLLGDMEIVLVSPDEETFNAAKSIVDEFEFRKFVYCKDPQKGKPHAINLGLQGASGEVLIFTDGDVVVGNNSLPKLVSHFEHERVGGVTGRPVSADSKKTMFGYWGNLLADVAHDKRQKTFSAGGYYYVSGYLYAIRKFEDLYFPVDSLVDDAWISLQILSRGCTLAYEPEALVYVKYPQNFTDWVKQKMRSVGGYRQLTMSKKQQFTMSQNAPAQQVKPNRGIEKRGIWGELQYLFFPLTYAKNLRELLFSLALYPARLYLWSVVYCNNTFGKKSFEDTWVRIESTK